MSSVESPPIFSPMSSDPDMLELVEEFVDHLKTRVSSLEVAFASDNLTELTRLAHQLKGASGGYGFDVIGQAAAQLEQSAKAADSVGQVSAELEEVIALCRRASAKPAPNG